MALLDDVAELRGRLAQLPRARLAHLPTPLDDCPRIGDELGVSLRIKRDDCTGLAFGGNKVREHEFILGDALAAGADCIVQGAASQSNHSRQLAAAGAALGLAVHLVPRLDARSEPVQGNYLIDHLLGARLHPIPADASSIQAKERVAAELRAAGHTPYIVGMGSERAAALAAVAYVGTACEIVEADPQRVPSTVVVASQGSTQIGLQLGFEQLGLPTRVIGINPLTEEHEAYIPPAEMLAMGRLCAQLLSLPDGPDPAATVNLTRYAGSYGVPTEAGLAALALAGRRAGLILDPVYSGKAFGGLLDLCARGEIRAGEEIVFVHTGGLPIVFAYAAEITAALTAGTGSG